MSLEDKVRRQLEQAEYLLDDSTNIPLSANDKPKGAPKKPRLKTEAERTRRRRGETMTAWGNRVARYRNARPNP